MLSAWAGKFLRIQRFSNVMGGRTKENSVTIKIQSGKGAMERVDELLRDIMYQS